MGCGIYEIKNLVDGKVYVGSSIDIPKRLTRHKYMLRGNYHDNIHLQNAFNKHGENKFSFEVIEICLECELVIKENSFIEFKKANNSYFGYNQALVSDTRRNIVSENVKIELSKKKMIRFKLINLDSGLEKIFDNLYEASSYLINGGFAKGKHRNVRQLLSNCLRGKIVDNGKLGKGTIRKSAYNHIWKNLN